MSEPVSPSPNAPPSRGPAPPQPPSWYRWLPLMGLALTALLLLWPLMRTPSTELSYSDFLSRVEAGKVATAEIDETGGVTGTLEDDTEYTTQIPTALGDNELAAMLEDSGVEVTGKK